MSPITLEKKRKKREKTHQTYKKTLLHSNKQNQPQQQNKSTHKEIKKYQVTKPQTFRK